MADSRESAEKRKRRSAPVRNASNSSVDGDHPNGSADQQHNKKPINPQRSCRAPTRHLLPQQWDAPQTTLNHLPNQNVDIAKSCFAVRFSSSQNEQRRTLKAIKENQHQKIINAYPLENTQSLQINHRLGDFRMWTSHYPGVLFVLLTPPRATNIWPLRGRFTAIQTAHSPTHGAVMNPTLFLDVMRRAQINNTPVIRNVVKSASDERNEGSHRKGLIVTWSRCSCISHNHEHLVA